jgi:hypothetical protein
MIDILTCALYDSVEHGSKPDVDVRLGKVEGLMLCH